MYGYNKPIYKNNIRKQIISSGNVVPRRPPNVSKAECQLHLKPLFSNYVFCIQVCQLIAIAVRYRFVTLLLFYVEWVYMCIFNSVRLCCREFSICLLRFLECRKITTMAFISPGNIDSKVRNIRRQRHKHILSIRGCSNSIIYFSHFTRFGLSLFDTKQPRCHGIFNKVFAGGQNTTD